MTCGGDHRGRERYGAAEKASRPLSTDEAGARLQQRVFALSLVKGIAVWCPALFQDVGDWPLEERAAVVDRLTEALHVVRLANRTGQLADGHGRRLDRVVAVAQERGGILGQRGGENLLAQNVDDVGSSDEAEVNRS